MTDLERAARLALAALELDDTETVVACNARHALREALASSLSYEGFKAVQEGMRNAAEDAYFDARPQLENDTARRLFCAGFDRGYAAGASGV